MDQPANKPTTNGRRKSILELAPLELACMNMLWPLGEATVRDIRDRLAPFRLRAYTTIMTIMDRLAQKGVVTRRKVGKAYLYRPNLTEQEARSHAVAELVAGFFGGSAEALLVHLEHGRIPLAPKRAAEARPGTRRPRAPEPAPPGPASEAAPPARLDETLL